MISVADGLAHVIARVAPPVARESCRLPRALSRVLAEDITAPFDVPPTDNSAVDGFALRAADLGSPAPGPLRVLADLPAGSLFAGTVERGEAVRIMTGAPIPAGADTVVPQELSSREGDLVRVEAVPCGANVRYAGEDVRAGQVVLAAGTVLRPQELGLIASLGLALVPVHPRPRVALLSTGDEVVEPGETRRPGQIYDANRFSLSGMVEAAGAIPVDCGIVPDLRDTLRRRLLEAAAGAEVVITSGGVSVGAYDLVKAVLAEIGGVEFWQVAMQPGRPLAVGQIGTSHFFGLPGNPVASMLCFLLFVRPALWKLAGRTDLTSPRFTAVATEPMRKKVGRQEFKRGILRFADGRWAVSTTGPQGSGILSSMVAANCLIVLEESQGDVEAGDLVGVESL